VEAPVEEGEGPLRHGGSGDVHDGEVAGVEGAHGLLLGGAHPQASDALQDIRTTQSGLSVSRAIRKIKSKKRMNERKKGMETRFQKYRRIKSFV
jgi:hypothetical protein